MIRWSGRRGRSLFIIGLALLLSPLLAIVMVTATTAAWRYADPARVPPMPVALVFGAGIRVDGTPSPMLSDRVTAAVRLYQNGVVRKLLMTGDNSQEDYNEVAAMQRAAVQQGVPEGDIVLDYAGFNTYDSCFRARAIFGVKQAVLVTQAYHLPRAVYTCRSLGIDAVGLGTPDWERYSAETMRWYVAREWVATLNAVIELHVTRPEPRFLGPYEGAQLEERPTPASR